MLLALSAYSTAFVPFATRTLGNRGFALRKSAAVNKDAAAETETTTEATKTASSSSLSIPLSCDQMIRQVASAMKEAAAVQGNTRQIVRILLPRDSTYGDLGKKSETGSEDSVSISLVPTDESWQGGIMQLYRAAAPTTEKIMKQVTANTAGGLPPRILEDRSVDESGFDGVSFFKADDNQISCWLQPTQENVDEIIEKTPAISADNNDIVALINPQWRLVDDALDTASKKGGFLGGLASFLGGKSGSLKRLKDAGFSPVYTLEGYVCRGANVRLLQVLDSEWAVFCERDNGESFFPVGTSKQRPTYQDVEVMLSDSDIGFKYARDIGMSPKL